ncbi:MAG: DUF1430 domain-containing protein [Clostridiales bacterium]|nr:DUF1430 domain-containing protein [Clostridiales bacterium]MCF8023491.1 DUF1430 domain-containing protein [Clostridiales bacterium]
MLSFYIAYIQTDKDELKKMENAEKGIARQFRIPIHFHPAGPDELYPLLCKTAKEYKVNIFRTNIHYNVDDQAEVLKYFLLTGDTRFFDTFSLKSGRFLTVQDTQQGNSFMSSVDTGDRNQIGTVREFGGNNLIKIKPLKTAYEHLSVGGQYYVEASDERVFDAFLKGFVAKVNEYHKEHETKFSYTPKDFLKKNSSGGLEVGSRVDFLKYINYMVFIITLILFIYYIFYESRRIGIMKMHGLSNLRLWFTIAGRLITVIFVLSVAVSLFAPLLIKDTTSQFIGSAIISHFKTYVIVTSISLISYIYISRIRVSDAIKNRKDTNSIFALNTLLKAGCSILVILICLSIWSQYDEIQAKREDLKNWEHIKDYGVFYPLKVGYDLEDVKHGSPIETAATAGELYPVLNKMGALLIEAGDYEEDHIIRNKNSDNIRSIKVNPNYLQEFPVYDVHNNPVQVSEDTSDWILLVPEKYRHREDKIMSYFKKTRTGTDGFEGVYEWNERFFKRDVPDRVKNQQIEIIWLANNQEIFSFNPEVFPAENNVIIDPIIQVVTEKNSICGDRANIISGGRATDALKMKLIDRDAALTLEKLKPELKKLKLDDNIKHLVAINQLVAQKIYNMEKWMNQLLLTSLGLLAGLLILVVQNLTIFFNKYQRKFMVRRLFGTGFFRTYKEYILLFSVTWTFQLLICYMVNKGLVSVFLQFAARASSIASAVESTTGTADIKLFAVTAGLISIELIATVIAFVIIEKRNKVKVLKGGN